MALTTAELARCRAELGYPLLSTANPYIDGHHLLFEQVIASYLEAGVSTTSSTAVTATSSPTPITLTLTSATGFASGARVVIDVDSRKETVTIQNLSGTSMTVQLRLTHSGTYPVALADSGEGIVREILGNIATARLDLLKAHGRGSIKRADDVEFYEVKSMSAFELSSAEIDYWRDMLASALGVESMWSLKRSGAQTLSVY
jgi:hypothetical protein